MRSVGHQEVINWVLYHSNSKVVQGTIEVPVQEEELEVPKEGIWSKFTNRISK